MLVAPYFAKQFYLNTKNNFRKFFVAREAVKNDVYCRQNVVKKKFTS